MTPDKFKDKVDELVSRVLCRHPNDDDVEFFIGDMEDLFTEYQDEK